MKENKIAGISSWNICARLGVGVAVYWTLSFLCTMYGDRAFLLSQLGLLIGLFSVFFTGRALSLVRRSEGRLPLSTTYRMSVVSMLCATLLTTMAQYLYFRFLDQGHFLTVMEPVLTSPEYTELMKAMGDEINTEEVMAQLSNPRLIAQTLLMYNALLSVVLALPAAIIAVTRKQRRPKEN